MPKKQIEAHIIRTKTRLYVAQKSIMCHAEQLKANIIDLSHFEEKIIDILKQYAKE